MKCERTAEALAAHMGTGNGSLDGVSRDQPDEALRVHLASCADCQEELAGIEMVQTNLAHWRDQAVPEWDRRSALQGADGRDWRDWSSAVAWLSRWQWAPLAVSLVLALSVVFNVQVERSADSFTVSFGSTTSDVETAQVREQVRDHVQEQLQREPVRRPDPQAMRETLALNLDQQDRGEAWNELIRQLAELRQTDFAVIEQSLRESLEGNNLARFFDIHCI